MCVQTHLVEAYEARQGRVEAVVEAGAAEQVVHDHLGCHGVAVEQQVEEERHPLGATQVGQRRAVHVGHVCGATRAECVGRVGQRWLNVWVPA